MYTSKYCDVSYNEEYNIVHVVWKGFCCGEDYRKPLEYALDIIKENENCNYLADTRNGFEDTAEDTKWVAEVFMPKAAEYGCKYIYFLIDENNSLKGELEGQERNSESIIKFRYIYSLSDIIVQHSDIK